MEWAVSLKTMGLFHTIKKRKIPNYETKYFIFEADCASWLTITVAVQLIIDD